jgi:cysteine desulfurase
LVSIGAANNEVGTIQALLDIAQAVRDRGILFHTDATQLFGKVPVKTISELSADLVSCCAHKLFGPKGAGALYVRSPLQLQPIITGGAQEKELRAGTENLAAIAGLVAAIERNSCPPRFDPSYLTPLTEHLKRSIIRVQGVRFWGPDTKDRLANTLAFSVNGTNSQTLLAALDLSGVCASAGSACSTGMLKPSHVLLALGATPQEASSLIRFSLGPQTTFEEIEYTASVFAKVVKQVRN